MMSNAFILLISCMFTYVITCSYGPPFGIIDLGMSAYGLDENNRLVERPICTYTGTSSILNINYLWYNTSASHICIKPVYKYAKFDYNSYACNYGVLNNGVTAYGVNSLDLWKLQLSSTHTTSIIKTRDGSETIKVFAAIMDITDTQYICFTPLIDKTNH